MKSPDVRLGGLLAPPVPPAPRSLRAGALWAFWGNAGGAACQWLVLSLMTKLATPAQVGHFSLALALVAPVMLLLNLQLRALQATDTTDDFGLEDYLGLRALTAALGLAVVLGISLAAGYRGAVLAVIAGVALGKTFDTVSTVYYGALHRRERMDLISISQLLRGVLALLLTWWVLRAGGGVAGATAVIALASLALLTLYDVPVTHRLLAQGGRTRALRPRFRWGVLGRLVRLALPLGVVMLLLSLIGNVPRYFIEHSQGAAELGIYSALAYLLMAGMTVVAAVGEAATPRLARAYAAGRRAEYARLSQRLLLVGAGLGAGGLLVALVGGRPLLTLLYTPAYAEREHTFRLLMVAGAVSYVASFLGYAVTAARVLKAQTPLGAGVLAVTFAASALLIPSLGIDGAALATLTGAVAQLLGFGLLYGWALRRAAPREAS